MKLVEELVRTSLVLSLHFSGDFTQKRKRKVKALTLFLKL